MATREKLQDGTTRLSGSVYNTGWVSISGPTGPGYLNGWVDFDSRVVQLARQGNDVFMRGFMKNGTMGSAAFIIPQIFMPDDRIHGSDYWVTAISNSAFGALVLDTSTNALIPSVGSNAWFGFDGVSWRAKGA